MKGCKTGGRQRGTPNKITAVFKEAVQHVFEHGGGHVWLLAWAKKNPTEFFKIMAKLIPSQLHASVVPNSVGLAELLREARARRLSQFGASTGRGGETA